MDNRTSGPTSCLVQSRSKYRIFNKTGLETVWKEKALKNLCEMKKKKKRKLASIVAAHSGQG